MAWLNLLLATAYSSLNQNESQFDDLEIQGLLASHHTGFRSFARFRPSVSDATETLRQHRDSNSTPSGFPYKLYFITIFFTCIFVTVFYSQNSLVILGLSFSVALFFIRLVHFIRS
jgi:hypothetical protein